MSPFDMALPIDQLHTFLLNPRDTSEQEFRSILNHLALDSRLSRLLNRIITNDAGTEFGDLWELMINIGFFDSRGNIRKMMQNSGLFINKQQMKLNTILDKSMFFDTGIQWDENTRLKFMVIRKGKVECDIVLGLFQVS